MHGSLILGHCDNTVEHGHVKLGHYDNTTRADDNKIGLFVQKNVCNGIIRHSYGTLGYYISICNHYEGLYDNIMFV